MVDSRQIVTACYLRQPAHCSAHMWSNKTISYPQELQLKKQALQSKFPDFWKLTGSPGAEERQRQARNPNWPQPHTQILTPCVLHWSKRNRPFTSDAAQLHLPFSAPFLPWGCRHQPRLFFLPVCFLEPNLAVFLTVVDWKPCYSPNPKGCISFLLPLSLGLVLLPSLAVRTSSNSPFWGLL